LTAVGTGGALGGAGSVTPTFGMVGGTANRGQRLAAGATGSFTGQGGNSFYGFGAISALTSGNGASGTGFGGGGGGAMALSGTGPFTGGSGAPGIIVLTEDFG
jgi:hypothetical protein